MAKLWVMCGLPASGKSCRAKEIAEQNNAAVFSSDELRQELFNDVNHQEDNSKLFTELHSRIKEHLKSGGNAVYDATNINYKKRMAFLQELKNIPCEKICVFMAVPYEECLRRNAERERKVPEYVIKRMYMNFHIPYWYEGWNDIQVVNDFKSKHWNLENVVHDLDDYDQGNSHHSRTLGNHLWRAYGHSITWETPYDDVTSIAVLLHDIGKPFCRTNLNARGDDDGNAHYFQHHLVGAYQSLFVKHSWNELDVAIRIMWHMQPYFWKEQKTIDKYRKLWGNELYKDIIAIHECDKFAH